MPEIESSGVLDTRTPEKCSLTGTLDGVTVTIDVQRVEMENVSNELTGRSLFIFTFSYKRRNFVSSIAGFKATKALKWYRL